MHTSRYQTGVLGQTGPSPYVEYMNSLKRANAELDYLSAATASNWEERVNNSLRLVPNEFKTLEAFVRGKTGNPDAEKKLFELWGTVSKTAINMNANKPGVLAQLKDKASIFFTDFWRGAQAAQQEYASWAVEKTPWVLKAYHGGLQKLALLKKDLELAKQAGRPGSEIAAQEQKIRNAEALANKVRSTFSSISAGASIDQLAIKQYGALSGPVAGALLSIGISLIVSVVGWFLVALADIKPLVNTLIPAIQSVQRNIADAAGKAGVVADTAKEKLTTTLTIVGIAALVAAAGVGYYFYKKAKVSR